jgi:hypothetical protein
MAEVLHPHGRSFLRKVISCNSVYLDEIDVATRHGHRQSNKLFLGETPELVHAINFSLVEVSSYILRSIFYLNHTRKTARTKFRLFVIIY